MNPDALIESYVAEVVRHLPRRQRNDVGFELRSLLGEELTGRAADSGREPDTTMALELLAAFGRPVEVADRYRPAGFTIISPADAPRFAWVALGGVAVQWAITLVATFSAPASGPGSDWLSRLGTWWLSAGLGAFWWPGLLVSLSIVGAAIGARRGSASEWTPRAAAVLDRDVIRRPLLVLAIAAGMLGAAVVIALPSLSTLLPGLPQPVLDAFAFDADFLSQRALWVLPLWAASFAVIIAVLVAGRWHRTTYLTSLAVNAAWLGLLIWWIVAGRIFESELADSVTKGSLALVAGFVVLDIVLTLRRLPRRVVVPA
jgi:hypothetical protein